MYIFTLTTKKDYFPRLGVLCDDKGHVLGRVISRLKVDVVEDNIFYNYDIDGTKEAYEGLAEGKIRPYRIEDYHVSPCSTYYVRK